MHPPATTSSSGVPTSRVTTSGPADPVRLEPFSPPASAGVSPQGSAQASSASGQTGGGATENWVVEVFFDGDCPLCRREINWLRKRDRQLKVRFTDIAAADFDPGSTGKTLSELMARIHGRLPTGELIEGVEVFRQLYAAVGLNWLVVPTRWPLFRQFLDWGYRLFARYRLRLTGRCSAQSCGTTNS